MSNKYIKPICLISVCVLLIVFVLVVNQASFYFCAMYFLTYKIITVYYSSKISKIIYRLDKYFNRLVVKMFLTALNKS